MKRTAHDAKILYFDLELSGLKADWAFIICVGYRWEHEKDVKVISIRDFSLFKKDCTNDREVVRAFSRVINDADILVAHYGDRMDRKMVNSRFLKHGCPPPTYKRLVDTWRVSRDKLLLHSNRQDSLSLFLRGKTEKTRLNGSVWLRAMAGHVPSIKYIEQHVVGDINDLRLNYLKLRPLIENHPNVNLMGPFANTENCPKCGNHRIQKRGWAYARTARSPRYWCPKCRSWSTGKPEAVGEAKVR